MAAPAPPSVFLHLGALGPRVLDTPASGAVPPPPLRLIDNASTWLPFTDLVFVDPVGTGFSRGRGPRQGGQSGQAVLGGAQRPQFAGRGHAPLADPARALELARYFWSARAMAGCARRRWRAVWRAMSGSRSAASCWFRRRSISTMLHPDISNLLAPATDLPSLCGDRGGFRRPRRSSAEAVERFALSDYLAGLAKLPGNPGPGDPLIARSRRVDRPARGDRHGASAAGWARTSLRA